MKEAGYFKVVCSMKQKTIQQINEHRIIAIIRNQPLRVMEPLGRALLAGGIRLVEVTFSQSDTESLQQTAKSIQRLISAFGSSLCVGAGTVMNPEQVDIAADSGAKYIISPGLNEAVVKRTLEKGLVSMPGALSPTEIAAALDMGADYVKLFPAGVLGTDYFKAISAPFGRIPLTAVGGINLQNAADFLRANASALGIGGSLIRKDWIAANAWNEISGLAAKFVKAVETA